MSAAQVTGGDLSPVFTTRRVRREDTKHVVDLVSNEGVYENFITPPYAGAESWESFCAGSYDLPLVLGTFEEPSKRLVGIGSLSSSGKNRRSLHVGFLSVAVLPEFQRRGIGFRLLQRLVEIAEPQYQLTRLEATISTRNTASLALFAKFGFEIEGTMQKWATGTSGFHDMHLCALLSERLQAHADDDPVQFSLSD